MSLDKITEKLEQGFEQHPEQAFIVKSLLMIALIIGTKILLGAFFIPLISFYCIIYLYFLCKTSDESFWIIIRENLSLIAAPTSTTQERIKVTPWVTWTLIIINSFIFLFLETDDTARYIRNNLMCLPATPNLFNYPLSFLTSMYLHADFSHMFGNMCFLWATGTIVERRIGWQRFLAAYHITGLAGAALAVIANAVAGAMVPMMVVISALMTSSYFECLEFDCFCKSQVAFNKIVYVVTSLFC